ncbi:hypothetical protein CURTO8I2_280121 [Curtobacterium sp. 8I-2]|nr:hypothetical protein CURTO8I2_280121 [Curtobacterium sp. 8I-2]
MTRHARETLSPWRGSSPVLPLRSSGAEDLDPVARTRRLRPGVRRRARLPVVADPRVDEPAAR